ncbi:MAG TPA: bifunctional 4-hydroxy-2-oxoglutarate aldolase/2-dehydro-3-deoxy-phosphogluconate aldolase [Candidatus Limnocylindrales bacterium]
MTAELARRARVPVPEAITGPRVIAIARGLEPSRILRIGEGLLGGGVRAFEVTLNSPAAFEAIGALAREFGEADGHAARLGGGLVIGAGTVLDIESARRAIDAGARFLVSPHTDRALIEWTANRGIPSLPGAFTPTEIVAAWRAGASAVKLFPASAVGPAFVRELRGPFRDIPLIPTGGVTIDTAPEFIRAGAIAIGVGSWLIGEGEVAGIAERGRQVVRALADVR